MLPQDLIPHQLDKLIHERVRLGIMAALAACESMTFTDLKQTLQVSDGNLSVHIKVLEDNRYVAVEKTFVNRKPCSTYRLSDEGKEALKKYITLLEKMIRNIQLE